MADPVNPAPENPVTPPVPSTPPAPSTPPPAADPIDPKYVQQLREEKLAFEKQLKELNAANKKRDDEALAEQNRFKDLYEKEKAEREALNAKFQEDLSKRDLRFIESELRRELVAAGAVDQDAVAFIDRSKISLDENTGRVLGAKEAIEALKTSKTYLFTPAPSSGNPAPAPAPGAPIPPAPGSANPTPKDARDMTPEEFKAAWSRLGRKG